MTRLPTLIWKPSPNFNQRTKPVDVLVLHADASPSVKQSINWIQNPVSGVSYHALIGRLGDIYQLVAWNNRAWHAGKSKFGTRHNCNDFSIGVSFGNRQDGEPFTSAQYQAGAELCAWLMEQFPRITIDRITTHSAVSPGRKTDPGAGKSKFEFKVFLEMVRGE